MIVLEYRPAYQLHFLALDRGGNSPKRPDAAGKEELMLWVVVRGGIGINCQGNFKRIMAGEYLMLPADYAVQTESCPLSGRDEIYRLHFFCHDVFMQERGNEPIRQQEGMCFPIAGRLPMPEKTVYMIKQLQEAIRLEYSHAALDSMLDTILQFLANQVSFYNRSARRDSALKIQKQVCKTAAAFVRANIRRNLKVADVALRFGYSEKYFSCIFHKMAGMPLKQFILISKMDEANRLLTYSTNSVEEIAASVGFSDSHNFSKAYKKICGITPSEYRHSFSLQVAV